MRKEKLLGLYGKIYLIRRVEEKIIELARQSKVTALVHLSTGQEACAVGMCGALAPEDYVWSNHRCHAHYLAKGGNLFRMFSELAGKETGCAHGWGGSMHLVDPDVNMMGSSSIVGSSIPLAAGAALASKLRNDKKISVAFLGDGALEEGAFWETLNFSVVHQLPIIFFCENNFYATHSHISKRQPKGKIVDRVAAFGLKTFSVNGNDAEAILKVAAKAAAMARKGKGPIFIEAQTYRLKEHWGTGEDWNLDYRNKEEAKVWLDNCPLKLLREKLSGIYNQQKIANLEERVDSEIEKAWMSAEKSKFAWDINQIKDDSFIYRSTISSFKGKGDRRLKYREAVAEAYVQAMEKDKRVFLLGEGVDGVTGIYGTVLPAYKKFGPKRVIDSPISEVAITGIAIGAAIVGMRPVVMHQRNDFLLLALSQIVHAAAFWKYMTGGRLSCPVTIRTYIARKSTEAAQHTGSWQSIFGHIPGLKVVMPANAYDAKGLTFSAIDDNDPVLILEHRALNENEDFVPEIPYKVPIGKAKVIRFGKDITIVAVSAAVLDALKAADILAKNNISAEVIDLVSIRPIDKQILLSSGRKTGRLIAVDTGFKTYGVGAEVCAMVGEELTSSTSSIIFRRVGAKEVPAPAAETLLASGYHPDAEEIVAAAMDALNF